MKKALGSWSGMRKYLEDEMLTPTLRGRVRYNCTRYVGMDNCHVFGVYLDGSLVKRFSWETVNDWLIENGRREKGYGLQDYWSGFLTCLRLCRRSRAQPTRTRNSAKRLKSIATNRSRTAYAPQTRSSGCLRFSIAASASADCLPCRMLFAKTPHG